MLTIIIIIQKYLCSSRTVSTLWAYTSNPDSATFSTAARSPRKSGVRHSTRIWGLLHDDAFQLHGIVRQFYEDAEKPLVSQEGMKLQPFLQDGDCPGNVLGTSIRNICRDEGNSGFSLSHHSNTCSLLCFFTLMSNLTIQRHRQIKWLMNNIHDFLQVCVSCYFQQQFSGELSRSRTSPSLSTEVRTT